MPPVSDIVVALVMIIVPSLSIVSTPGQCFNSTPKPYELDPTNTAITPSTTRSYPQNLTKNQQTPPSTCSSADKQTFTRRRSPRKSPRKSLSQEYRESPGPSTEALDSHDNSPETVPRYFTLSNNLELLISNHARLGNNIWVTCSADIIPQEHIAEFLVNGVTSDIILRQRDGCFSSITRTSCSPSTCNCSDDGKIYSLKINVNQEIESVNITCSMRFRINTEVFKTEAVNIKTIG
ncbi:unnamed protein product [Mytilus edulis]|uniref:Immunoglobulin subtype domain-containing protein n=1 Tax=Mytilus edulis TaxID=6550 RepID=A0A8S3UA17_MYTED|nr:unnamed protein product [Mytilus edulis]